MRVKNWNKKIDGTLCGRFGRSNDKKGAPEGQGAQGIPMVATSPGKRGLLLLRTVHPAQGTDHGSHRADIPWRKKHKGKCGALL